MVRLHSIPLHGLRTSRYRGDDAVCCPSGRLGIAPNIGSSVVKLLCRPSPVFPRFPANGSHRSIVPRRPFLWVSPSRILLANSQKEAVRCKRGEEGKYLGKMEATEDVKVCICS